MNLRYRIMRRSVTELMRIACLLALAALALMVYSVIFPRPLPVILAMSLGHLVGGLAFITYLLAIIIDAARERGGPLSIGADELDRR